jgi:hypothetical protein
MVIGRYVGSRRWRSTICATPPRRSRARGEQPHRAVQILGVLADDRDAVGAAVLDQHLAVAVEHDAARRPQRERPLMVVLRHLLELRVLHDLQHPEADREDRERPMIAYCRIESGSMPRRSSASHTNVIGGAGLRRRAPFHRSR